MTGIRRGSRAYLALIVALYLLLGVVYSLATPVLEASDEFKHYPYVQHVQTHSALPILDPATCLEEPPKCPWLQDGGQPPLYYVLLAAATSWIDTSELPDLRRVNWHAFIGNPGQVCNKNLIIHHPEEERYPWHGAVLAVHVSRLITVVIGAGSVVLTYLAGRELFPDRPALTLGATALMAFNPMFIFVNASVNNDAMTTFVGCLNLLVILRLARDGLEPGGRHAPLPLWRYGLVGLTMGLFLLTKLSALTAMMLLPVLLAWISYRRGSWRPLLVGLTVIVAVAAAMSGWWFVRNWRLYGDVTGLNAFIEIQGRRGGFPSLRDWIQEFVTFRWTYWGLFGAVNVMAPLWVYRFLDVLSLVGLAGFGVWAVQSGEVARLLESIRHPQSATRLSLLWVPALWGGILFVSVLRWTWIFYSFQGRFMFPNIGGISALLVVGLNQWAPRRCRAGVSFGVALSVFMIAAMLPVTSILPAYAQPEALALSDVPENARVDPVPVGEVARVVGWEYERQSVRPNEADAFIDVVVYWESLMPDGEDYISFAHLLGPDYELVGEINRRPACGMIPTDLWQPGQVWRDPYRIPVTEDVQAPSRLLVEVGLYDPQARETLGAVQIGEAKVTPPNAPRDIGQLLSVDLADGVTLSGYDLAPVPASTGQTLTVTLHWTARVAPSRDYQVFVHLLGDDPEPLAQGDGAPLTGDYPTSLWSRGEMIADPHFISLPADLPAGQYRILVGMYNLATLERLPRLDSAGTAAEIPVRVTAE